MFVVGVNNAGASGTTAGDFAVGNTKEFVSWDASAGVLSIQGEITNVGPEYTNGRAVTKYVLERDDINDVNGTSITSGNQDLTEILDQLGGAGAFGFALVGGGASGSARETNNDSAKAFGGGAGGMALFAYEWNGSTAMQVNLGVGGAGSGNGNNVNFSGAAGTASTFSVNNSVNVTANPGTAGGAVNFTNGSLVESNNAGSVTWADGNDGATDFPIFQHTCLSGHGGAVSRSNSLACGGGGIQITPWNPITIFPNATDPTPTGGTLTVSGNGATSGGSPWGPGVLVNTGSHSDAAFSPYRLDAGGVVAANIAPGLTTPPDTRVVQPRGSDSDLTSELTRQRGGNGIYRSLGSAAGTNGGPFCGGGGGNSRRVDTGGRGGDGGLGGGGAGALGDSGSSTAASGDGGDGCIIIWRIS